MKKSILFTLFAICLCGITAAQTIHEARKLTEYEQYEAASVIYKSLLNANPSDVTLYYFYGDNLLRSDNPDSAKIIFDLGFKLDPTNAYIKIGYAKLLLDEISLREARASSERDPSSTEMKARLERAEANVSAANTLIDEATSNTKSVEILIQAANAFIHYKNKNTDKAKKLLDQANTIEPKNISILLLFGDIYTELNNGTLAADYYNQALEINKNSARAIVSKGLLYKRSTNYEGAIREFEDAIRIEPGYAPAHRELGEAYIKLGKLSKAKEAYEKYLELSKNNCGARIRYATFLYLGKDYPSALNELDQVKRSCDSNNTTMLRVQSYCYFETKEYVKGLSTVNHLFTIVAPGKRTATDLEYYGKLLIKSNQDSAGIEQLQKAYALDPARTDLISEIGDARLKLKQYPEAIKQFSEKIMLNQGKDAKVTDYYSLSKAYYSNGQLTEADSLSAKVNELSPKWSSGWLFRAQINANIDSTSQEGRAKPFYEKFIELALADSANSTKYHRGLIESYGYMAYYYILKKENPPGLEFLKKKLQLPLEPEDKKNVQDAIDQLEGRPLKNGKK